MELDEFREVLIASDIGPAFTEELLNLVARKSGEDLEVAVREQIFNSLSKLPREILLSSDSLTTLLIVGVNGTGKTTSAAKLANALPGKSLLAAADTFRAAAVDQLKTWGQKLGINVISGADNADPASVAFDATSKFKELAADNLIIDTAGRLHNKADLMAELGKIRRVVEKSAPISEVLLVIDATTGQNGLAQAEVFIDSVAVTGIILTKLDGSARGGIALAIERKFDIPVKWVGTGESVNDFETFDANDYLKGLLS